MIGAEKLGALRFVQKTFAAFAADLAPTDLKASATHNACVAGGIVIGAWGHRASMAGVLT